MKAFCREKYHFAFYADDVYYVTLLLMCYLYNAPCKIFICVSFRIMYCTFYVELSFGLYTTFVWQAGSVALRAVKGKGPVSLGIMFVGGKFHLYFVQTTMPFLLINVFCTFISYEFIVSGLLYIALLHLLNLLPTEVLLFSLLKSILFYWRRAYYNVNLFQLFHFNLLNSFSSKV